MLKNNIRQKEKRKMARRGENIFKRKDGRWEARIARGRENGKCIYLSLYGKTYAEVKAKKEEYLRFHHFGEISVPRRTADITLIAGQWLLSVKGTVKESTYSRYHRNVYVYILPDFGGRTISKIDSAVIDRFKDKLLTVGGKREAGLSAKTTADILSVLKLILSYASKIGYQTANTSAVRNPRSKKNDIAVIPREELERLEGILLSERSNISVGILLALHTGIRNGELCGLTWGDIDLSSGILKINRPWSA